ncbi:MAG TPA: glycosyltransferase [Thermoplasmata archaeon]|nr:glycosyltransferase [Thermoplasmata archaeon]
MNILWISKITDREYWRTTQLELSKSLRKRGNKVILVMAKNFGENKPVEDDTIYLPILPHYILSGLIFGLALFFYFPLMVRKEKIDVIMIDGTSVWLPFVVPLKLFKVPLVIDVRDLAIEKKTSVFFDFSLFLSKYIADGLTTITLELREVLREKYCLCDKKIGIWSSGVSLENFNGGCSSNSFHGEKTSNFTLLHHGSYGGDRGIENLILAIGKLDEHIRRRVKLLLVGIPVEHQKGFLRLCEKVGVEEQVNILPIVDYEKIPFYIQMSDVGVVPLPSDKTWCQVSAPLKTLEYLAMGKPIIATGIPFHRSIFEKGNCGILVDANTPETLAEAITSLYKKSREKIKAMGEIGREIVEKHYSWDNMAFKVERFLKDILQGYQNEK